MKSHAFFRSPIFGLILSGLAGGGCASTYKVQVDSIARAQSPTSEISSYQIHTRNALVEEDRLRYQEAARLIKTALSSRGWHEAPGSVAPDVIVEIDYGIEEPRVKYERLANAIYGPAGATRLDREPALADDRNDSRAGRVASGQAPAREVIGFEESSRTIVVREKYLSVSGRENKPAAEGRPPNEIFYVHVSIENESKDLRAHLPILTTAAMAKIGQTTDGMVTATLRDSDDAVGFIRKGL